MRCLRRPSLSATRTFCWRSAICAFLRQTIQSSALSGQFGSSPTEFMEAKLLHLSPEANFCLQVLHLFVQRRFQSPVVLQLRDDQSPTLDRDTINDIINSHLLLTVWNFFFFKKKPRSVLKTGEFSSLPWFWQQDDPLPRSAVWGCWPPGPTPFCPPAGHWGGAGPLRYSPWPPLHSETMSIFMDTKGIRQRHTFSARALYFLDLAEFYILVNGLLMCTHQHQRQHIHTNTSRLPTLVLAVAPSIPLFWQSLRFSATSLLFCKASFSRLFAAAAFQGK